MEHLELGRGLCRSATAAPRWTHGRRGAIENPGASLRSALPFVGRDAELEVLHDRIDSAPPVTVISGPAGIGKTRLLTAAIDSTDQTVLYGRAWRGGEATPYVPWTQILSGLGRSWAPKSSPGFAISPAHEQREDPSAEVCPQRLDASCRRAGAGRLSPRGGGRGATTDCSSSSTTCTTPTRRRSASPSPSPSPSLAIACRSRFCARAVPRTKSPRTAVNSSTPSKPRPMWLSSIHSIAMTSSRCCPRGTSDRSAWRLR